MQIWCTSTSWRGVVYWRLLLLKWEHKAYSRGTLCPAQIPQLVCSWLSLTIGQNVGILTKIDPTRPLKRSEVRVSYPVEGSKCKSKAQGLTAVSKHYLAQFKILLTDGEALDFYMLGCHLLAYPTDPKRCSMREAQAHVMRHFLKTEISKTGISEAIILGDINDFDEEVKVPYQRPSKSRV